MTKIRTLQLYRGTTAQNDAYTGSIGELTMDTTTNELRLHDGSTAGGHVIGSGGGGSSYHPDLFDVKWADHICNDVQWLRADTYSWQSGAVYQVAYQHLADDIDGKTLQSETVAGTTIQFYLADDGHKICPASEESNVASIYSATGVAWYYIIDTANTRFKLPRTQFAFTGIRSGVGAFVEEALPNIRGQFSTGSIYGSVIASGAFTQEVQSGNGRGGSGNGEHLYTFNANNSSSVYKDGATVQPKATEMYLYFYVGSFTQTALENTAGITTEEMNNKVNIGHEVIEFQEPTAANNYTWYRKYRDGWVEQGGYAAVRGQQNTTITLPVEMADANYVVQVTNDFNDASNQYGSQCNGRSTTQIIIKCGSYSSGDQIHANWQVSGMAA